MSDFNVFKKAVSKQYTQMCKSSLFCTGAGKDELWDTYLSSFPDGTNPIYKERTEHDCQCCKQFIRATGNVVAIVDNKLVSIWDINIGGTYQVVADALSKLVKSAKVADAFLHYEANLGTDFNHQQLETDEVIKWEHFHFKLPSKFVMSNDLIPTKLGDIRSNKDVFIRGVSEITIEAATTVLELIEQKSLYRGEEHKQAVEIFISNKKAFDRVSDDEKDNYSWVKSAEIGGAGKVRNSVVGTLLVDISNGVSLDTAVGKFESKVAPTNYKRPTALITKSMIAKAQQEVQELGIEASLQRRFAVTDDITINNVLFADRSVKKAMNVFDELSEDVSVNISKLKKVEEVDIKTFVDTILPKADSIELLLENRHTNNLMSLIAPSDKESKNILKWGNNFSWAYKGEVADSMKERVAKAGGRVDGVMRFSIQWNDGDNNQNDFDAHCIEPDKNLIYYSNKGQTHRSSGKLDVDITQPGNKVAVENITWTNKSKMQEGEYTVLVHNYSHNGGKTGFTAELEYEGVTYSYAYDKELRNNKKVVVAKFTFSKAEGIRFTKSLPSTQASKYVWGKSTNKFHKVNMVMNSPNHWDGEETGNKHWFFIIDDCINDNQARGFFNEFLSEKLTQHRKVFEVLGSKMKVEQSDNQLSGLGFSSTVKNSVFCKVSGSFSRTIKINF